ncbi:TPA: PBP1A family penicillin-binding protein [Streptococcus pneumoniae]|uniref:Penicillin-binding protein 1A n=8 Tax=Streptococcus pneumoniae TaxID=1313 RepID=PBPA_STRR6|nr:penicillin-binding protein PBP1A [Streptococcus pneumoniae]Q8DR59.1 RecName: Full=Penicillin-binding protein 1A; Short=PBP-1A; AltName: Full=Exported protein 2; Includes: RecName: Full=Penicillin-insensitive transglycosylase; AltName: Full=Peptidoglycan TGase; Includes: RecName: Full=Penicillin-sensitive transpeptidase; AltName: Full=DD-transpeptidase [Streptococcus pneumoniae R6]EJG80568.1 penicillin-binding protein 1A [Streptococcus pneumoniae SPAR27]AAA26956.1 penicillin-binding protein [S
MNKPTILRLIKYLSISFLSLVIAAIVLGGGVFFYYVSKAPSLSESKLVATTSSKIYDNKNQLIADLGSERRVNAQANDIPTDLVKAIVSIEDHRFFDHRGIDTIRILGAFLRNLQSNSLQGGSALTQQLIKLTYFSTSTSDQTISRKAQEAWLAIQLEQKATKQEILTYYINKVYMSNGNYGMQTAAQNYYGKDLNNLSLPQLALLAGMPQAPNQYDPYSHPEAAQDRRNLVLSEMKNQGYISAEQYEKAVNTPITDGLQSLKSASNYPAYMDNYLKEVINQVEEETGYNLLTTGMDVYTNVDQEAQKHLWDIYNTDEYVAYPDDELQVASTIVDVSNGKVIAQLGARHQSSNVSFGINQAVETNRDWGSTMKPITDYAPALEYGVYESTATIVHDEPYNYPGTNTPVYNWDRGYFGNITLQYALQQSRNVPAVETLNKVGLNRAKTFLNGLGIDYPSIHYSNAISSNTTESDKKYGASSEKMAAAYAAFANGGTYYKPMYIHKVVFSDGSEKEFSNVGTRAMKETTAYMMTDMMKTVLSYGTGRNAYLAWLPQAGKTGTSNYTDEEIENHIKTSQFVAPDELFAGYTRKYSMAVWTGYSNRLTPLVGNGLTVAAKVYRSMMTYLSEGSNPEDWNIPEGLYRNGEFVFKNGARSTWSSPAPQQPPSTESSSSSSDSSTSQSSSTTPSTNNSTTTNPNNNTQQSNTTPDQQNQNPQPAQP